MRQLFFLFCTSIFISLISCRSDFETVASSGGLTFSRDTIFLDTVFSTKSSSTYALKVYNNSKSDINIPKIELEKGLASKYRMSIDGMQGNQGKLFENTTLLANDSLYVFIEVTANSADSNPKDFLYTDNILFDAGNNQQKVALVTLIQDAVFLFPNRLADGTTETVTVNDEKLSGFYLDENDAINGNELHFNNQKAYVIYGNAVVPSGKKVVFDAGARVYFHEGASLIVEKNASLEINGTTSKTEKLENEVVFEGDRLEPDFSDITGQWSGIRVLEGSLKASIHHLTLKNATTGLLFEKTENPISITNTQVYNCSTYGIWTKNASIIAENVVINNAGLATLACLYGGAYSFTHCTINNNWNGNSQVALSLSNSLAGTTPATNDLTAAIFNNCIIYGSYSNELSINKAVGGVFNYKFNNCLIKQATSQNPDYQFETDAVHYKNIILNKDPKFLKASQNKLNIDSNSSAFAKGDASFIIATDIVGATRTLPPDLGAYQSKAFAK